MILAGNKCGCPSKSFHQSYPSSHQTEPWINKKISNETLQQRHPNLDTKSKSPKISEKTLKEKNVSEITRTGLPYKEIEAIINNNKMVLRIQKISTQEEWDPPCDCGTENFQKIEPYGDDVSFRKVNENASPSTVLQERTAEPGGSSRRTITVVSHPDSENPPNINPNPSKTEDNDKENKEKSRKIPIDLEENPNLFILKIRRKSDCSEGRENIDLEFRTPRPWRPQPKILVKPIKRPSIPPVPLPMLEDKRNSGMDEDIENEGNEKKQKNVKKQKNGKKKKK